MSKFCSNCGQQLNDEKFCPNCGTAQEVEQQNQVQQPTPEVAPVYKSPVYNQVPVKKKKGGKLGCLIAFFIPFLVQFAINVFLISNNSAGLSQSEIHAGTMPILLLLMVVSFCFYMAVKTTKAKSDATKAFKNEKQQTGCLELVTLEHVAGLPIPSGVECSIYLYDDKLVFSRSTSTYDLGFDRIADMCIKTETEIQNTYASSIGGAVGGGLLFGPLGAIVGGRAKKKNKQRS